MEDKTIRCPQCGKDLSPYARFCDNCGYIKGEQTPDEDTSLPSEPAESTTLFIDEDTAFEAGSADKEEISQEMENVDVAEQVLPPIPTPTRKVVVPPIPKDSKNEPVAPQVNPSSPHLPPPIPADMAAATLTDTLPPVESAASEATVLPEAPVAESDTSENVITEPAIDTEVTAISDSATTPPPMPPSSSDNDKTEIPPITPIKPKSKKKTGLILLIVGLIVGAILLIGGCIAAYFIFRQVNTPDDVTYNETSEDTEIIYEPEDEIMEEVKELEEVASDNHYEMQTLLSGKDIIVILDISPDGFVRGKYAYNTTSQDDDPTLWYHLVGKVENGNENNKELILDASHPREIMSERWVVTLSGKGKYASLSGKTIDYINDKISYVGSTKPATDLYKEYDYSEYDDD